MKFTACSKVSAPMPVCFISGKYWPSSIDRAALFRPSWVKYDIVLAAADVACIWFLTDSYLDHPDRRWVGKILRGRVVYAHETLPYLHLAYRSEWLEMLRTLSRSSGLLELCVICLR